MKRRIQNVIAFAGAPFLAIDFFLHMHFGSQQWQDSLSTRVFDILFMAGWLCSVLALIDMRAAGDKLPGRIILYFQLVLLILAGSTDLVTLLKIPIPNNLFYWDLLWPMSNVMMLTTGISIAFSGRLKRWQRFVPLLVGCWLPICLLARIFLSLDVVTYLGGMYSAIAWTLLAYVSFERKAINTRTICRLA